MSGKDRFEELYRTHYKRVYGFAFKLTGKREDALEVTQETFMSLYVVFTEGRFDAIDRPEKWLLGVTRYKANERWRKQYKHSNFVSEDEQRESASTLEETEAHLVRQEVRRWLEERKEDINIQMLLMYLEGFKSKELSVLFECSESSVRKRIQRTKEATMHYFRARPYDIFAPIQAKQAQT